MESIEIVTTPKFPILDTKWLSGFLQESELQANLLVDFFNFLNLLAMQETYAMAERVKLKWFVSYFQVDRGALFSWKAEEPVLSFGLDRNDKILEKFSYDKKALNRVIKQKEMQFPSEEENRTQAKRAWVIPFCEGEEVVEFLYLDCLSGTRTHFESSFLKTCYLLSQKFLQHRSFPDQEGKKKIALTSRKQFKYSYHKIIGRSPAMFRVFEMLDKISEADHLPALILGKSGTGKELVAEVIHENSPRRGKPFVAENCAAVTETLLESELFGYVAGAFTGAEKNKKGLFEFAHTGSLFLDEVGDMSLEMQKKLLRVLQEGEVRPVGAQTHFHVDVRIIAATNRDLKSMIQQGLFREDLYFRLSALVIHLPDLSERGEDVEELLDFFLEKTARELGQAKRTFSLELKEILLRYPWPGNVRELENEVKRMVALGEQVLTLDILSPQIKNFLKL